MKPLGLFLGLVSLLGCVGCGEDRATRQAKEKELVDQANEACSAILHPNSDQQVVAAYEKLKAVCAEVRQMQPPHPEMEWFEFEVRRKQETADAAQARIASGEQNRAAAERARKEAEEQKRLAERARKEAEEQKRLAEAKDAAPKEAARKFMSFVAVCSNICEQSEVAPQYKMKSLRSQMCDGIESSLMALPLSSTVYFTFYAAEGGLRPQVIDQLIRKARNYEPTQGDPLYQFRLYGSHDTDEATWHMQEKPREQRYPLMVLYSGPKGYQFTPITPPAEASPFVKAAIDGKIVVVLNVQLLSDGSSVWGQLPSETRRKIATTLMTGLKNQPLYKELAPPNVELRILFFNVSGIKEEYCEPTN